MFDYCWLYRGVLLLKMTSGPKHDIRSISFGKTNIFLIFFIKNDQILDSSQNITKLTFFAGKRCAEVCIGPKGLISTKIFALARTVVQTHFSTVLNHTSFLICWYPFWPSLKYFESYQSVFDQLWSNFTFSYLLRFSTSVMKSLTFFTLLIIFNVFFNVLPSLNFSSLFDLCLAHFSKFIINSCAFYVHFMLFILPFLKILKFFKSFMTLNRIFQLVL